MSHSFSLRFLILVCLVFGSFEGFGGFSGVDALVTLESIRRLTDFTGALREGLREGMRRIGDGESLRDLNGHEEGRFHAGQMVFDYRAGVSDRKGDGDERLKDIAVKIQDLCDEMKKVLDIPLSGERDGSFVECEVVKQEYHGFMGETVGFLHDVQEAVQIGGALTSLQMDAGEGRSESVVYGSLERLQMIWASRRGNKQNRSFIEQQLECYQEEAPPGCFGKNVVLRHDVEVVEYLNWLLEEVV